MPTPVFPPTGLARALVIVGAVLLLLAASAQGQTPSAPLTQGFEDGAPGWATTGMWHIQSHPDAIQVAPAIADRLVTLPDDGFLPSAAEGVSAAWFGQAATGTYCGSDYATVRQTPQDGCTSSGPKHGALTSPAFSLASQTAAFAVFRGWWEIEAVNADVADLMQVQYSTDGGVNWVAAGLLNPLAPAWGGVHQAFGDGGARQVGTWIAYAVDLSGAVGHSDVRVRVVFDTVDSRRNGFRGLLVDGVAIVDGLGATISQPGAASFTDALPTLGVEDVRLAQDPAGDWNVGFSVVASHPSSRPIEVDWSVHGRDGSPAGHGHAAIAPGQSSVAVATPVSGAAAPYTATITNPTGATVGFGQASAATPGGSLPVLRLDPVLATEASGGQLEISVAVELSAPSAQPVRVDYTLVGSDGVPGPGGTLEIAPSGTAAGTTLLVPAEHAPYTVVLANPRNALLDPAGTTGSSAPLAGTAALDPGSQLVLGVREGSGDHPILNRTFYLTYLSGTISYHKPGGPYVNLTAGTAHLPLGSVVDATSGHVRVTVEVDSRHTLATTEVWGGKFGVFQVGSNPVTTELRLAGGDFSVCPGAPRKRARRSASPVVRQLWASGKGNFRTKGRFASATVRGTKWLTEDLCLATRVTVEQGIVAVFDFRRKLTRLVRAGSQVTVGALQSARFRKRRGIHAPRLSRS